MLRDTPLLPVEALRLAALGMLAEAPRRYGDLAAEIQHFTSHITGPSLELMGTSLELLRVEGLIAAAGHGTEDNALLSLTDAGRAALADLLRAGLKPPPGNSFNRLLLALKLRFLQLMPAADQVQQIGLIAAWYRAELERIEELHRRQSASPSLFLRWLDQEIAAIRLRLDWLTELAGSVQLRSGRG